MEVLTRLSFRSQRGERSLRHVEGGQLSRSVGLQGIYRLSRGSAADLAELMESPSGAPRLPQGLSDRRPVPVPAPEEALF